jgi:hypothetical protein
MELVKGFALTLTLSPGRGKSHAPRQEQSLNSGSIQRGKPGSRSLGRGPGLRRDEVAPATQAG